ncbi:unnamed protein product, partial [marine sediment metagenome]
PEFALGLAVFSVRDAGILLPRQDKRIFALQLHQWARKGWICRLKRGLYEMTYPEPAATSDFLVANRLYEPSYVSLETALSHYQILPETAAQVTSVTCMPTRRFKNHYGLFTYFTVRPAAFAGYTLRRLQGQTIRIAEPEKAVVDRLYAGLRRGESLQPVEDRWDLERLKKMHRKKLMSYAALFGAAAKKLEKLIYDLLR